MKFGKFFSYVDLQTHTALNSTIQGILEITKYCLATSGENNRRISGSIRKGIIVPSPQYTIWRGERALSGCRRSEGYKQSVMVCCGNSMKQLLQYSTTVLHFAKAQKKVIYPVHIVIHTRKAD